MVDAHHRRGEYMSEHKYAHASIGAGLRKGVRGVRQGGVNRDAQIQRIDHRDSRSGREASHDAVWGQTPDRAREASPALDAHAGPSRDVQEMQTGTQDPPSGVFIGVFAPLWIPVENSLSRCEHTRWRGWREKWQNTRWRATFLLGMSDNRKWLKQGGVAGGTGWLPPLPPGKVAGCPPLRG